jgi:hypothetical protein
MYTGEFILKVGAEDRIVNLILENLLSLCELMADPEDTQLSSIYLLSKISFKVLYSDRAATTTKLEATSCKFPSE